MTQPRLLEDIQAQPRSLAQVIAHQSGVGRQALLDAASLLKTARQVIITGIGASMFASIPFEYFLCSLGIPAFLIEAAELLHYRERVCRDSIILMVSRSGESIEIVKLLGALKGHNKIIGVSNDPSSSLARSSDVAIHIGSLPDEMVAIQSYTGTLLTLHKLGYAISNQTASDDLELQTALDELPSLIDREIRALSKWDELMNLVRRSTF